MNNTKKLGLTVLGLLILNILTIIYMQVEISQMISSGNEPTAYAPYATGTASVCVNNPPNGVGNGSCNFQIPWGYDYNCTINATDPDNAYSFTYTTIFLTNTTVFNTTNNGTINTNPPRSALGNHTARFYVNDNSGCSNALYYEDRNIEIILANHAPYLATTLPNIIIRKDNVQTFFLDSYFTDPDDDDLNYTLAVVEGAFATITTDNSSFTTITGTECGIESVFFIATDSEGLTATSNTFTITVYGCAVAEQSESGSGGGGGGGGGVYNRCIPEWRCGRWSQCFENNTQKLECRDYNGCNPRDYIRYFEKNCTYIPLVFNCDEDWECGEWGICKDEFHNRECVDKNSCGTVNEKPIDRESCIPITSCFNGIKDGNETSIDCGGECGACKLIEQPAIIEKKLDTTLIIAAILSLGALAIILYTLRVQIGRIIYVILGRKKRKKNIYLTEVQKQKLLNEEYILQQRLQERHYDELVAGTSTLLIDYFKELLGIEQLNKEKLSKEMVKLKNEELQKILHDFYFKIMSYTTFFAKHPDNINNIEFQAILDEFTCIIYLVSEFTEKDALICVKERNAECKDIKEECHLMISNLYIALEFTEISEAKNIYRKLLKKYDLLQPSDKKEMYQDILRNYTVINYIIEQNKK